MDSALDQQVRDDLSLRVFVQRGVADFLLHAVPGGPDHSYGPLGVRPLHPYPVRVIIVLLYHRAWGGNREVNIFLPEAVTAQLTYSSLRQ